MKEETLQHTTEIERIKRVYYKQLYTNKSDNLEKMDEFLETYNLTRLNHEETENPNGLITSKKIKSVMKNLQTKVQCQPHLKKN